MAIITGATNKNGDTNTNYNMNNVVAISAKPLYFDYRSIISCNKNGDFFVNFKDWNTGNPIQETEIVYQFVYISLAI